MGHVNGPDAAPTLPEKRVRLVSEAFRAASCVLGPRAGLARRLAVADSRVRLVPERGAN